VRDLAEGAGELAPVEERAPELRPARGVDDREAERREDDDRARGRDQDGAVPAGELLQAVQGAT
jgi:hypothetical protein